jgi:anti-sigma-K factor RskA
MSASDEKLIEEIEEGQLWLSQFDTPLPSAAAMARAKQAIRHEIHGPASTHPTLKLRHGWRPWHGALASAASIALAVLVGYSRTNSHRPEITVAPVATTTITESDLITYTTLDSELSELESIDLQHGTLADAWDEVWSISEANGNQPG